MILALLIVAWFAVAAFVAGVIGRGIKLADDRARAEAMRRHPAGRDLPERFEVWL